jgi:hypothetical protein
MMTEISAQQAMCGSVQKPLSLSATCRAASSELHHATSVKLVSMNDYNFYFVGVAS